jgi:TolA-binding protein
MLSIYQKPIIVSALICLLGSVITRDALFGLLAMVGLITDQLHSALIVYVNRNRVIEREDLDEKIKQMQSKIDSLTATISMLSRRV